MSWHFAVVAALVAGTATGVTGCSETIKLPGAASAGGATASLQSSSAIGVGGSVASRQVQGFQAGGGFGPGAEPPQKSMASKVMAAIALERVTGRKPDPGRLAEAMD